MAAQKHTMNVSLTPELDGFVKKMIASGNYGNQSEVIRAALRLLSDAEAERAAKLEWLRAEITLGIEDIEAGRHSSFNVDEFFARRAERKKQPRAKGA